MRLLLSPTQAERHFSDGVHPRLLCEGVELAKTAVLEFIDSAKIQKDTLNRDLLIQIAAARQVSHKSRTRLAHVSHKSHTRHTQVSSRSPPPGKSRTSLAHVSHTSHTSLTHVSHTSHTPL